MHAVCELLSFRADAKDAGMSVEEIDALVLLLAENPMAGDEIQGTGGCRKFRLPGRGKGKSGGYRVVTFYSGVNIPVFLLTVFSKGEKANLNASEKNALKQLTQAITDEYGRRVSKLGRGK